MATGKEYVDNISKLLVRVKKYQDMDMEYLPVFGALEESNAALMKAQFELEANCRHTKLDGNNRCVACGLSQAVEDR